MTQENAVTVRVQMVGLVARAGQRHRLRCSGRPVCHEESSAGFEADALDDDGVADQGEQHARSDTPRPYHRST